MKLRLPIELRDRIAAIARANKRSMNAEIVARLEESVDLTESFVPSLKRAKGEDYSIEDHIAGLRAAQGTLQSIIDNAGAFVEMAKKAGKPLPLGAIGRRLNERAARAANTEPAPAPKPRRRKAGSS